MARETVGRSQRDYASVVLCDAGLRAAIGRQVVIEGRHSVQKRGMRI